MPDPDSIARPGARATRAAGARVARAILGYALPGWGFSPYCWDRVAAELARRGVVGAGGPREDLSGEPPFLAVPLPDLVATFSNALDAASLAQARRAALETDWRQRYDAAIDAWIDQWSPLSSELRIDPANGQRSAERGGNAPGDETEERLGADRVVTAPGVAPHTSAAGRAGSTRAADGILLAGWSLGGGVALDLAERLHRRSGLPVRVLLVATHPAFEMGCDDEAFDPGLGAFWTATARPERLRNRFLRLATQGEADPATLIERLAADWNPRAFLAGSSNHARATFAGDFACAAPDDAAPPAVAPAVAALRAGLLLLALSDRRAWPATVLGRALFARADAVVPLRAADAWSGAHGCRLQWLAGGHAALHARADAIADAWCDERARFVAADQQ